MADAYKGNPGSWRDRKPQCSRHQSPVSGCTDCRPGAKTGGASTASPPPSKPAITVRQAVIAGLIVLAAIGALVGREGGDKRAPLGPDSSCEDRYWYATNSPSADEYGTDSFAPKDEWIANCEQDAP